MTERSGGPAAEWTGALVYDVRHALRTLSREPALLAGVVLTLALALGANAAMFGIVSRLLFSPPSGVRAAHEVHRLNIAVRSEDGEEYQGSTTSYPAFRELAEVDAFASAAAVLVSKSTIGQGEQMVEVSTIQASGDYFRVLGAGAQLGRVFGPADDELPLGSSVVVLSHDFWQRNYAGARTVIGQELRVNNQPFTVIGVTAPRFSGDAIAPVDLFLPLSAGLRNRPGWWSESRINLLSIIARVRGPVAAAEQQASALVARAEDVERGMTRTVELESLVPGKAARDTPRGRIALWLSGVTLVVLLTAAANVGTLLLLRAARRRRDLSVRLALGVGRARLLRQLLLESMVLALAGGVAGLLISHWLSELIRSTLLVDLAPADGLADAGVLLITALATFTVGLLAALSPMLLVGRLDLAQALQSAGGRAVTGKNTSRLVLIGAQVALTTVLLVGAGLFVRSLDRVKSQDLGFSTARLVYVTLDFKQPVPGPEHDRLYLAAKEHIGRINGVTGVTEVQAMPFGNFHVPPISVPGLSEPPSAGNQFPFLYAATPEFLRMMRVQLRAGRLIDARDTRAAPLVVLVNETMAREVWPGESAVGKCIRAGHDPALPMTMLAPPTLPCREVVGVVSDSRARSLRRVDREASMMQYYVPFEQVPAPPFADHSRMNGLLVEAAGDPRSIVSAVQRSVQRNLSVPVYAQVRPYQDLLDRQMRPWLLGATLFSVFGLLALAIAAVGLFAVISYSANEQTRANGIRLALGAKPAAVRRLVLFGALRSVAAGLAIGLLAALALGRFAGELLFETSTRDPLVLAGAAGALLIVTCAAATLPSLRSGRISPVATFRVE